MSKKRNTQPKKRMSTETDDTQSSSTKKEKKLVEDEQGILVAKSKDGHETFTLFYGGTPYLSNFYMSPFTLDQNTFNCGEQYFHYKKAEHFGDTDSMRLILAADSPREQKALGRRVAGYDEVEWQRVGLGYMKEALVAKFDQNARLRELLQSTTGTTLVEASPRDRKWGIGLGMRNADALDRKKWRGSNILGQVLMDVRDELESKSTT